MIETRHLRVLRAVARAGSFSAAARELGCTQPAVSQQVKALEQAAGTPLVVRAGRETRLTEAGRALVRHASGILAGLTAAEEEVAAIAGLRAGRVRMVSFPSGSSAVVPGAVARMRTDHPGTTVSLEEAEPPRSVEMLRSGDCEVALAFRYLGRHGPPDEGEWDGLVVRPLLTDRLVGVLPAGHRLAGPGTGPVGGRGPGPGAGRGAGTGAARGPGAGAGAGVEPGTGPDGCRGEGSVAGPGRASGGRLAERRGVPLAELADEPWIAGCPRCRRHLLDLCAAAGFTPRVDFATDDYPAVAGLVAAGLGVALLPELALRSVRPDGLVLVDVEPDARREVVALTLPELAHVPAVDRMLGRLAESATGRS